MRFAKDVRLVGFEVEPINCAGDRKAGESVEGFGMIAFSGEAIDGANSGKLEFMGEVCRSGFVLPLHEADEAMRVLEVEADELLIYPRHLLERFGRLGDNFPPVGGFGVMNIDGDYATAGGLVVRLEKKGRVLIIDETIGGGELGDEFDNWELGFLEIFVEDEVFRVGALADMNDQETAVVRNRAVKSPVGMISALVN